MKRYGVGLTPGIQAGDRPLAASNPPPRWKSPASGPHARDEHADCEVGRGCDNDGLVGHVVLYVMVTDSNGPVAA